MADRIKVMIVEDHAMVAEGLDAVLSGEPGLEVVGVATTGDEARTMASARKPDVVLMDHRLPDADGVEVAGELLDALRLKVVVLTADPRRQVLVRAVEVGCSGFLDKARGIGDVVRAVRAAHTGEAVLTPAVVARFVRSRSDGAPPTVPLSPRELELLRALASGRTTGELAGQFVLSIHTVRNHVRNILTKLSARSKLEAVAIAAREGYLTMSDFEP